jgi:hypothetical protein
VRPDPAALPARLREDPAARLAYIVERWGGTLARLAEGDGRPAPTDACRAPDGRCDGSCEPARP